MIRIELTMTDDNGQKIVVSESYDGELTGRTVDTVEQLVYQSKNKLAQAAEVELLQINQNAYTLKKSNVACVEWDGQGDCSDAQWRTHV